MSRIRFGGSRPAAAATSCTSGTARLRGAIRMVATSRSGSRAPARPTPSTGRHAAMSRPFGSTSTGASKTSATRRAAALLTAVSAAGTRFHAVVRAPMRSAGTIPSSMQCQVMTVGSPWETASRAPSNAKGDTIPACTCTTSGCTSPKPVRSSRGPLTGLTGRSNGIRVPIRCTRTPSRSSTWPPCDPSSPGVAVNTCTSSPDAT